MAVADTESAFNPTATSPKGAHGFFQLMPATATELGVDINDPVQNIRGGLKYLKQQLDANGGNVEKALQAYNWGPGNVAKGGTPPQETRDYVTKILGRLKPAAPAPVATVTVQDFTKNIGQPPPRKVGSGTAPPNPTLPSKEGLVHSVMSSFDPRTRTGRRNIAGGVGDAVGTAAGTLAAPFTGPAAPAMPALGGAIGSGLAGGAAELGERFVGTAPPDSSIPAAMGEQAAYSVGGRALAWPLRAIGKRVVGTQVGRFATESLDTMLTSARDALGTARELGRDAVQSAADTASTALSSARESTGNFLRATKQSASEATERVVGRAKQTVGDIEARYSRIATAPPTVSSRVAGQRAQAVIEGPAKSARQEVGQMVEDAARSGPEVDIKALKAEALRIMGEEIRPSQEAFPRGATEIDPHIAELQALAEKAGTISPEELAKRSPSQQAGLQAVQDALAKAQEDQAQTILKHPAMNVIGRILNADDTVPFEAAHLFKRELDDAIGTAWDRSVKSRVTNITKVLRGSLRDALSVHQPYNIATRAYQEIAPLYSGKIARQLQEALRTAPEAFVRTIRGNDPTKLGIIRDLLLNQPAKVGKGNEGQFAWDSLRSAWTHEHLIQGPVEKIDERIAKLDPEFAQTLFGDGPGKVVLDNLKAISAAYKSAIEQGAATVGEVKAVGKGATEAAREIGRQTVSATQTAGRQSVQQVRQAGRQMVAGKINDLQAVRAEAKKFVRSSLVRAKDEDLVSDALRAGGLGIRSIWGAQSIARLILRGPKSRDLVYFASHAPEGTQLLVRALTGAEPGLALAELLRMTGLGSMVAEGVGTPPPKTQAPAGSPRASNVGAPPP